jgi:hypothetical protein
MQSMKKTLFIVFAICISYLHSTAQDENYTLYNPIHLGFGLTGGLGLHSTNSTLRCIGDPGCPTYDGGIGSQFGIMGNIEWMPTDWGMRGSIGFSNSSVEMSTTDNRALVKDVNGVIVPLVREHSLNISLPMINMDLGLQKSFRNSRVFFGPSFGFLLSPNWKSTSTLLSPNNVTFNSGSRDTVFLNQEK